MKKKVFLAASICFSLLFFIFVLVTNDFGAWTEVRSGSLKNPYVEEPLSEDASQYEPALKTSNAIVEMLRKKKFESIYNEILDENATAGFSQQQFHSMLNDVFQQYGDIRAYKPMQWYFRRNNAGGVDYLDSIKIVEHERSVVAYYFTFEEGGDYLTIKGFHIRIPSYEDTDPGTQ